jgi:hypothetical protein
MATSLKSLKEARAEGCQFGTVVVPAFHVD